MLYFFFNDTATTEIYTLSLHDALPIWFCFTQAFQSIGLGLATAIGAAMAQPHRLPVAALGDGGFLMSVAELETVVRLGRSEEHTSELSHANISYAVFCLKKKHTLTYEQ